MAKFKPATFLHRGNLLSRFSFHPPLPFQSRFYSQFVVNPQFFIDSVRQQCRLGFSRPEIPLSIFHQLNSLRPRPSIIIFNQLFTAMSKIKPQPPFSTIVTLYNQLELSGLRPNCHSIAILAKCYSGLGRLDFAFSLLGKSFKLGYPPDIVIFNTLLNALIVSDKLNQAVQLLDKIVKLGIQPDILTYGSMFKGLCRCGDNSGALRLLRDMESNSPFKPNVVIYSTIIDGLCKDGLLLEAITLFKEMKGNCILPNVVTYTSLIRGLCSLGLWDDAGKLLTEMLDSDIVPNIQTYTTLIDMYCKDGNVREARVVFDFMIKSGVKADIISYSALLDGYCMHGEMEEAEKLLGIMVSDGVIPDAVTFNTLTNDMHLKGTHVTPDVCTYNTIIDALCKDNGEQKSIDESDSD